MNFKKINKRKHLNTYEERLKTYENVYKTRRQRLPRLSRRKISLGHRRFQRFMIPSLSRENVQGLDVIPEMTSTQTFTLKNVACQHISDPFVDMPTSQIFPLCVTQSVFFIKPRRGCLQVHSNRCIPMMAHPRLH